MAFPGIIAICVIYKYALSLNISDPDGICFVASFSMFCLMCLSMFVHVLITLYLNFPNIFSSVF